MIKVNYNGYDVEVGTVNELKELLGSKKRNDSVEVDTPRKTRGKGKTAFTPHNRWEEEEIRFIIQYIGQDNDFFRESVLIERHTEKAIDLVRRKIKANLTGTPVNKTYALGGEMMKIVTEHKQNVQN